MLETISLLRKKPDWTREAFQNRCGQHCATLVTKIPGLVSCDYDGVLERVARVGENAADVEEVDGFLQLRFESTEAWERYVDGDAGKTARAAEAEFVGEQRLAIVEQREVIPVPRGGAAFKRMSLVRRHPDLNLDQFLHEWREVHVGMVKAMPKVLGYRQSAIVQRQSPVGTSIGYDRLPFDGIVELWFGSAEEMGLAYGTDAGRAAVAHVQRTAADMQAFRVGTS